MPALTAGAPQHDWLDLTGGAIGRVCRRSRRSGRLSGSARTGAEGDGSGMYTMQALWTMAREGLDVTTVIFSNRKYAILQVEFLRVGAGNPGRKADDMLSLNRPDLDWVALAKGMGVPATRATTAEEFNSATGAIARSARTGVDRGGAVTVTSRYILRVEAARSWLARLRVHFHDC